MNVEWSTTFSHHRHHITPINFEAPGTTETSLSACHFLWPITHFALDSSFFEGVRGTDLVTFEFLWGTNEGCPPPPLREQPPTRKLSKEQLERSHLRLTIC